MPARFQLVCVVFLSLLRLAPALAQSSTLPTTPDWGAPGADQVLVTDELWHDASRNREIPVKIYSPVGVSGPLPVVLFSHGLGGNVSAGEKWGRHWASWGIISIHLQHHGSDSNAILTGSGTVLDRLHGAMTAQQLLARTQDVLFAVAEVARRAAAGDPALAGAAPVDIGFSGHSFGAQTVLAVAGQRYLGSTQIVSGSPFRAFIAFSPSAQKIGDLDRQFGSITAPFLSMTGSQDRTAVTPDITPENRTLPYQHMASGHKYLLWLDTATHMSFGGQAAPRTDFLARALGQGEIGPDQIHIDRLVDFVSTAFWLAYLTPDSSQGRLAAAWLAADGPKSLCNTGDRWETR